MSERQMTVHETIDGLRAENNALHTVVNVTRDQLAALREYNREIRNQKAALREIIEARGGKKAKKKTEAPETQQLALRDRMRQELREQGRGDELE